MLLQAFLFDVTLFSTEECDNIQKPFIHALLPKMGMNCHIKRDIVYGPLYFEGRGLCDLQLEQPACAWLANLGHIRQLDTAGQGLLVTLVDHQVYMGSTELFFNLNPAVYTYGPSYTRWTYMWTAMRLYNVRVAVSHMWKPQLTNAQDVNIMDAVVKHPAYVTKDKRWKIWHVNQVQLYLKVFNLSDLLQEDGVVSKTLVNGERPVKHHPIVTFPPIQKPKGSQWSLFVECIFCIRVSRGYKLPGVSQPFHKKLSQIERTAHEIDTINELRGSQKSLQEILTHMPPSLMTTMGKHDLQDSSLPGLEEALCKGHLLEASDGSLSKVNSETNVYGAGDGWSGSHGYYLMDDRDYRLGI